MNIEQLVKMANQIGSFFEAEAPTEAAALDIATHLKRFWDPRMRRQIVEHVDGAAGEGLMPIVVLAIERHRDELCGQVPAS